MLFRRARRPFILLLAAVASLGGLIATYRHLAPVLEGAPPPRRRVVGRALRAEEAAFPTLQATQYNETAEDPYEHVEAENLHRTLVLPPDLNEDPLLNTRPVRRPPPMPDDGVTKYLSWRPHGGSVSPCRESMLTPLSFHNQRIALQNAIALAYLTNRTLLVPLARLGRPAPQAFSTEGRLGRMEREDKDGLLACATYLP